MRWNRALALLLALLMAVALCGCGKRTGSADASASAQLEQSAAASAPEPGEVPPVEEGEVQPFGLGYYEGLGLNPYTCDNVQNQSLMGLIYEPLFELDEHFAAQGVLAESITAKARTEQRAVETKKDKTTTAAEQETEQEKTKTKSVDVTDVTITLRKGVKFSDGSGLHADDVAYSLERSAAKGSVYRSRLSSIRNVSTSGKNKLSFTIDGGAQSVAELLDVPIIKNGQGDELFPVGSGPYAVKHSKKGKPVALTANEHWWRQGQEYQVALSQGVDLSESGEGIITLTVARPFSTIRLYTAGDSDELIFGFSSGAVTAVESDLTAADALSYTGSYDVSDFDTTDLLFLGCNTAKGPCQDQKLRSAIYRSVNRERIVERMMAGHARTAELPVAQSSALWDEELARSLAYNRDKAGELCRDTGVESELRLIVNQESVFKKAAAREAARHLNSAGLNVKVDSLSWKEYKAALNAGDYDLYFGEVVLGANFDLSPLLARDGSLNFSKYESETLTPAEAAYRKAGRDTRAEAAKNLFTLLSDEAPVVPLCFKSRSLLSRPGVITRNRATQSNLFHWFWDWTLEERVVAASG